MVPPGHPRDLLVWHGLCFAAMAGMLVMVPPPWLDASGLALFAVGVLWCAARVLGPGRRTSYAALGVCCLAMLAMLVPGGMTREAMGPGHRMGATPSLDRGVLTVVLVAALVCVALAAGARLALATGPSRPRAAGAAEVLLASAMAAMLSGLV